MDVSIYIHDALVGDILEGNNSREGKAYAAGSDFTD